MRRRLASLATTLLIGVAVLAPAAPATAHSELADSTPAQGETLTELPEAFSVTANEPVLDLGEQGVFALQIRDAAGGYYGDGCVTIVDATMSAEPVLGESGAYTMLWQIVSADGHPVSGEIAFEWQAPTGFEPAPAAGEAPRCGGDLTGDVTDVESSPSRGGLALGILIAVAVVLAGVAAAVIVAATRRRRAT
jgi:methionine-rich copper-binding protein CopC